MLYFGCCFAAFSIGVRMSTVGSFVFVGLSKNGVKLDARFLRKSGLNTRKKL